MDAIALSQPQPHAVSPTATRPAATRLLFIDNVRWVMILLVLSMHAAVTYSGVGRWYFADHQKLGRAALLFFATYQSFLQAFFMVLLFFIAGVFVPQAYDRKGAAGFVVGRLVKLGLPTALFVAVIGPVTEYFVAGSWHIKDGFAQAMARYFAEGRFLGGTGPLWFCAALLIFSLAYAGWRLALPARPLAAPRPGRPSAIGVALAVAALSVATFLVRLWLPVGTAVYNMQLCYFAQYVIMFALGIAASRGAWLERVPNRFAWTAAALCVGIAVVSWLPLLVFGGAFAGERAAFNGGLYWQSAAMAAWESLVCVGMSFAVLALFRAPAAGQGPVARFLSANAFAVYVIHPPLLVLVALALTGIALPAVAKFALLWALGAVLCSGVAAPLVRRLPGIGRILQ